MPCFRSFRGSHSYHDKTPVHKPRLLRPLVVLFHPCHGMKLGKGRHQHRRHRGVKNSGNAEETREAMETREVMETREAENYASRGKDRGDNSGLEMMTTTAMTKTTCTICFPRRTTTDMTLMMTMTTTHIRRMTTFWVCSQSSRRLAMVKKTRFRRNNSWICLWGCTHSGPCTCHMARHRLTRVSGAFGQPAMARTSTHCLSKMSKKHSSSRSFRCCACNGDSHDMA